MRLAALVRLTTWPQSYSSLLAICDNCPSTAYLPCLSHSWLGKHLFYGTSFLMDTGIRGRLPPSMIIRCWAASLDIARILPRTWMPSLNTVAAFPSFPSHLLLFPFPFESPARHSASSELLVPWKHALPQAPDRYYSTYSVLSTLTTWSSKQPKRQTLPDPLTLP
jgi:hypothetical protein